MYYPTGAPPQIPSALTPQIQSKVSLLPPKPNHYQTPMLDQSRRRFRNMQMKPSSLNSMQELHRLEDQFPSELKKAAYNLDEEKNKMSRPPKACGYQIDYPYMVMPMNMQEVQVPKYSKKIERAKEREIHNLQLRNSYAKAKLQKLLELTHLQNNDIRDKRMGGNFYPNSPQGLVKQR